MARDREELVSEKLGGFKLRPQVGQAENKTFPFSGGKNDRANTHTWKVTFCWLCCCLKRAKPRICCSISVFFCLQLDR